MESRETNAPGTTLPEDPFMLLSVVNTMLRDRFDSLDELCSSLGIRRDTLMARLQEAGFTYSEQGNRFW